MSSQDDINPENFADSAGFNKDVLFDPKPKPKIIRVLTVLAYVLSVSMAAIMLSIYYIFMWDGRPHIGARRSAGPESVHNSFGIPHQFTEIVVHSVGNITEHHHLTPSPNFIYITKRNTFSSVGKWKAENPIERKVEMVSLPSSFTDTFGNDTENSTYHYGNTDLFMEYHFRKNNQNTQ